MKKKLLSVIAMCLCVCVLLSGCFGIDLAGYFERLASYFAGAYVTDFDKMEYVHPDMDAFAETLESCCAAAKTETSISKMEDIILSFYAVYDDFYTSYALAMIYYSQDLTDAYWEQEYNHCAENTAIVDAALDQFYRVLADCPLREKLETDEYFGEGYFDSYEGESIYDEQFTSMLTQEAELANEYYGIYAQAGELDYYSDEFYALYGSRMEQIFLELVLLRQQIADYVGYDSYVDFAYDFYYARDYTPEQVTSYLADIRAELAPLYQQIVYIEVPDIHLYDATESQTFAYVESMATAMGGIVEEAFAAMKDAGLYDISYGANKYNASFEIYLTNYHSPFVFMNPTGTEYDLMTFAHEFGHFCNDYASYGSYAGTDVAEIFSQGMEYLSLCYGDADDNLTRLKMLDCLCVYVEQAAYASFEQQVYGLPKSELTTEGIAQLYADTMAAFGIESTYAYALVTHFYTNPMYIISYVVSNDAAFQLYQMEKAESGSGLGCLEANLDTYQYYFLSFLEEAGLESPFTAGRITRVKETLQGIFY